RHYERADELQRDHSGDDHHRRHHEPELQHIVDGEHTDHGGCQHGLRRLHRGHGRWDRNPGNHYVDLQLWKFVADGAGDHEWDDGEWDSRDGVLVPDRGDE